jgi:uncharacterized protein YkwD
MRASRESKTGGRKLRYLWLVAAVLAVLIAGIAAGEKSARATAYDAEELNFLRLINDYREDNGLGPLLLSDTLSVASERHSHDMARYHFFAHITAASSYYAVNSEPWDRMRADGYDYNTFMGENIAVGYESAEAAFAAWRRSPSHNAAMLDGRYRVIGIARIHPPGSRWYWTTDFGATEDPTSHAPSENPQAGETDRQEKPVGDGPGIENGNMNGEAVWKERATDGADLIFDGYSRLGDYDNGEDDLSQKIRVGENTQLAYGVKITTNESDYPFDRLLVRLTDEEGREIAVLRRYGAADESGWRRQRIDLSRFAGRTLRLSFHIETDYAGLTAFYVDDVVLNKVKDPS